MQGHGGISTASYKSRAVGNPKVQYSVLTAPLQESECLHKQKLSTETACADFALELYFSTETVISPVLKTK